MQIKTNMEYYINLFLEHSYVKNKKATYTIYRYIINKHISPFWKHYELQTIDDYLVIEFIELLNNKQLKNKSIKEILLVLKGIFKLANINIIIPMPKVERTTIKIFSKDDQSLLEELLLKDINNLNFSIFLSLYTGIRIGELCALKYSDINYYKRTLNITKTMSRVYDKERNKTTIILDTPKTYNSTREIPIPPFLMTYLRQLSYNEDYYIVTGNKNYMQPRLLSIKYKQLLKSIKLDNYTFHALRHTFATNCINMGANVKTLSLLLGHKSVEITLNRYIHPDINEKYKIMNNLKPINEKMFKFQTLKNKVSHLFKKDD